MNFDVVRTAIQNAVVNYAEGDPLSLVLRTLYPPVPAFVRMKGKKKNVEHTFLILQPIVETLPEIVYGQHVQRSKRQGDAYNFGVCCNTGTKIADTDNDTLLKRWWSPDFVRFTVDFISSGWQQGATEKEQKALVETMQNEHYKVCSSSEVSILCTGLLFTALKRSTLVVTDVYIRDACV